jgi:hypothetical protein
VCKLHIEIATSRGFRFFPLNPPTHSIISQKTQNNPTKLQVHYQRNFIHSPIELDHSVSVIKPRSIQTTENSSLKIVTNKTTYFNTSPIRFFLQNKPRNSQSPFGSSNKPRNSQSPFGFLQKILHKINPKSQYPFTKNPPKILQ